MASIGFWSGYFFFGKVRHELLKAHLVKMIQAESESEFDDIQRSGQQLLHSQSQQNGQKERDLVALAELWDTYT